MVKRIKRAKMLLEKSEQVKDTAVQKSQQSLQSSQSSQSSSSHHHKKRHHDCCPNSCEGNWNGSYAYWPLPYAPLPCMPVGPLGPLGPLGPFGPVGPAGLVGPYGPFGTGFVKPNVSYCNPIGSCANDCGGCGGCGNCDSCNIPIMTPCNSPLVPFPAAPFAPPLLNPYVPSGPYVYPPAPIVNGPLYDSIGRPYDPLYPTTNCRGYGGIPWS